MNEAIDWIECWLKIKLRKYQKSFIELCEKYKRIAGLWCRQTGKSTAVAAYSLYKAVTEKSFEVKMVASTLRQSGILFDKVLHFVETNKMIDDYCNRKTRTILSFKNGSEITCLPCGPTGDSIRGFTANLLIIDESGIVKTAIVNSVLMPYVSTTRGAVIKTGTPLMKNHFYQSCYGENSPYVLSHVDWRMAVNEGHFTEEFINEQREGITDMEFKQEYEAQFCETADSFFTPDLLDSAMEDYRMIESIY